MRTASVSGCGTILILLFLGPAVSQAQMSGTSMTVGRRPMSAVFSLDGSQAWVVTAGNDRVSILDRMNPFAQQTITVRHVPEQISLSADGRLAFVTSQARALADGFPQDDCGVVVVEPQGGSVTFLNTQTRSVAATVAIASGRPILALPARRGDRLFVVTESGTVEVVDIASRAVIATVGFGQGQVFDAVLHPDDGKLFISRYTAANDLIVLDTRTHAIRGVSLAAYGYRAIFGGRLTIDPSGAFLFGNVVSPDDFRRFTMALDTRQETPLGFLPGGFGGIAFRPDGRRVYLFSPEFLPGPGYEGVSLDLPALSIAQSLPVAGQNAVMARDGSTIFLARHGASFRYGLMVSDANQFRYDLTTVTPDTNDHASVDLSSTSVRCTVARDLILSPDGTQLLVTNPAVDTVTWFTLPAPSRASSFFTVSPCRLADSRQPVHGSPVPHGGPAFPVGSSRTIPVTGHCGIPTTARAVSVNLTVTQAASAGHLTVFPTGENPAVSSIMNFRAAATRANNATLSLGPSGALTFAPALAFGAVHVLVDVVGYWQ